MDTESETKSFKALAICALLFLVTGYISFQEIKYVLFSDRAEASVRDVRRISESTRRGRTERWLVEFSYADKSGNRLTEREKFPVSSDPPRATGETFTIEYLAGAMDSARPVGRRNWVAIIVFLLCSGGLAFYVGKLVLEARAYGRECRERQALQTTGRKRY